MRKQTTSVNSDLKSTLQQTKDIKDEECNISDDDPSLLSEKRFSLMKIKN